jgi:hypothetical protein
VRATIVTEIPLRVVVSLRLRSQRWMLMSGRLRRPELTGTEMFTSRLSSLSISPHSIPASAWLSTAPGPHARTPASHRASVLSGWCPRA